MKLHKVGPASIHITPIIPGVFLTFIQAYFIIPVAIFAIITSVFLITLPILQKPAPTLLALAVILLGIPVYVLFVMETPWRLRPKMLDKISSKFEWRTTCSYKLALQYLKHIRVPGID